MSITRTKRKFYALRSRLEEVSDALEVVEAVQVHHRDRLIVEIDHVLRLLGSMLEVHGGDPAAAASLRERMDSTLDERLHLTAWRDGGAL
jgi:hypothetical protein